MVQKKIYKLPVTSNKRICQDIYLLELKSDELAQTMLPGQFLHVSCGSSGFQILRRPLSIFDCEADLVKLLYKVVGKGTASLTDFQQGDIVDLIAPLGNSFVIQGSKPLIIGGGIGVAPLRYLVRGFNRQGISPTLILGYANADQATMSQLFRSADCQLFSCTMDGTFGFKGNSCQLAAEMIQESEYDVVYACGPNAMLANLPPTKATTFLSLEAYMACGVGACLGCAVEKSTGGFYHVCKDGPVFLRDEVIINV